MHGVTYRIPTHGKILKLIDFERAFFMLRPLSILSDCFHSDGDAAGQYTFPVRDTRVVEKPIVANYCFDMCRLALSILDDLNEKNKVPEIIDFITHIRTQADGKTIPTTHEFAMYEHITKHGINGIPEILLRRKEFQGFATTETPPEGTVVYSF